MKRQKIVISIFLALVICTLLPTYGGVTVQAATLQRIQGNCRGTSQTATIVVNMTYTPTQGNTLFALIAAFHSDGELAIVESVVQTGITWTLQHQYYYENSATWNYDVEVWKGTVGSGASPDITITMNDTTTKGYVANVCEYYGNFTLDQTADSYGTTGTTLTTGTTGATSQNQELLLGLICGGGSATHHSPTNGFTLMDGAHYASQVTASYLEKFQTTIGTAGSAVTATASSIWAGTMTTFIAHDTLLYTITVTIDDNVLIDPYGSVQLEAGQNQTFVYSAENGYYVDSVEVDSNPVPILYTYTFSEIGANHTLNITTESEPLEMESWALLVLLILTVIFVVLAFVTREPFVFAIAAFLSVIFGIDLSLTYLGDVDSWAFGVVGLAMFFFGLWLLVAAYQFSMKKRDK